VSRSRVLPLLLATLLLVGGLNLVAYAADGHPLLLGRTNQATSPTTVRTTGRGPALRLESRAGSPSLRVTSGAKVPRLNADRVDGLQGAALGVRAFVYGIGGDWDEGHVVKSFPGLPPGRYWVRYELRVYQVVAGVQVWLDNGTPTAQLSSGTDQQGGTLTAEGIVDARNGVVMHVRAGGIFYSTSGSVSTITFVRLTSVVQRDAISVP
jgi:hypothetical protein